MDLNQASFLASVALDMTDQPDVEHTLDRIMANARQGIACEAVGILLTRDRGRLETAAATEDLVRQADDLQMKCGEGPCLYAIWTYDTLLIHDAGLDQRWPLWGPRVAELGWRSVLSARLFTPERTLGALNLYSRESDAFDADDADLTQIFARHASIALLSAQNGDSLRQAIGARHLIGQAQGILMERYQIDAERAFAVLRRYSQDRNIKLRSIAEQVIATRRILE